MASSIRQEYTFPFSKSIFVSSTFKDMQKERDVLHRRVVPELNEFARKYGGSVRFTDLRWGVNTTDLESNEGAKKVLKVCLDEINRCRPYMIVLLGDRYGSTFERKLINTSAEKIQFSSSSEIDEEISMTELEIRFGALENPDQLDRCLFYFRKPLPEGRMTEEQKKMYYGEKEDREKIEKLKKTIMDKGGRICTYHVKWDEEEGITGLDAFAQKITEDLQTLLLEEWGESPKELTWQDRELISDRCFIAEKCSHFVGRKEAVAHCKKFVEEKNTSLLIIRGEAGSGKSSLMCQLSREFADKEHAVVSIFCGNSTYSTTGWNVLQSLVYRFEQMLGITDHFGTEKHSKELDQSVSGEKNSTPTLKDWRDRLGELMGMYIFQTKKTPVILIDALDQLLQDENARNLEFLPEILPEGSVVLISCLANHRISEHLPLMRSAEEWQLPELSDQDIRDAIHGILFANRKELDKRVIEELLQKSGTGNILYLSMVLQRLIMFDTEDFAEIAALEKEMNPDDAVSNYMIRIIHELPEDLEGMCVALIDEAGERINASLVDTATDLIAASRYGLRETDLAEIFSAHDLVWDTVDFTLLKRYLAIYFMELGDGRVNFTHKSIREGLRNDTERLPEYRQWIFSHLAELKDDDPVRISEMVYHAYAADQQEFLIAYFGDIYVRHESEVLQITASAVRDICLSGGSEWFGGLAEAAGRAYAEGCIQFFLFQVDEQFIDSIEEMPISLFLMNKLRYGLEALPNVEENSEAQRDLSVSLNKVGEVFEKQGKLKKAQQKYQRAMKIFDLLEKQLGTPEAKRDLSVSLNKIGNIFERQGKFEEAQQNYQQMMEIAEQLAIQLGTPEAKRDLSVSLNNIGNIFESQGKLEEAQQNYQQAMEIDEQLAIQLGTPEAKRDLAISLDNVGDIFDRRGKFEEAQKSYKQAMEIREQLAIQLTTPEAKRDLSVSLNKIGNIFESQGKLEEAQQNYQQMMEIAEQLAIQLTTPEAKRDLSVSLNKIGNIFESQGKLEEAQQNYQQAMEIDEQLAIQLGTPEAKRDLSVSLEKVGDIFERQGKFEEAQQNYQQAMEICEQLEKQLRTSEAKRDLSVSLNNIGNIFERQGKLEEAQQNYQQAMEICEQLEKQLRTPQAKRDLSVSLNNIGNIFESQGKLEEAQQKYQQAMEIREQLAIQFTTLEAYDDLAVSHWNLGIVVLRLEIIEEAKQHFIQAATIWELLAQNTDHPVYHERYAMAKNALENF
ncbi:tetratricopeptide repeat protein [Methanorbis furvi]|uniref:Photosystem I assembly protein Ycf3 n=1 Tax=Methanorbis furvi TaxID=3028299 RepID=A0AAE4MCU5_9EURY|nr:Photosystem I assembly protein Ycf3 [Methanocorpusculaceae archaeon Ag1]